MLSKLWNCNRLWKIWYGILVTILEAYVIFNGVRQYINFKSQYYNPRYGGAWDFGPLHFYIGCIIISIALMGFFLYFSLINVYCEPCSSVACRLDNQVHENSLGNIGKSVALLVRERLPYSHLLHFVMSICLLLPIPVVQMEQIRNEVLSPDSIWTTNIDFFSEHFEWSKPNSLSKSSALRNIHYLAKSSSINLEFINFSIASLLIVLKMPTVFWLSHKGFAILYSILIFFNCLTWLMIYEAGSILIKFFGNSDRFESYIEFKTPTKYSILMTIVGFQFLLTVISFFAVFVYGCSQTLFASRVRYKTLGLVDPRSIKKTYWITGVIGLGFTQIICSLTVHIILYSILFKHYQVFKFTLFMFTMIIGIIDMTLNFLVWFTFAIKSKWVFNPETGRESNFEHSYKITGGSPDAIYGCFHNNITSSTSSSHSSGPGTMRTLEGPRSECSGHGTNYQNYIYMQANALNIPTISEDFDENQTSTMKSIQQSKEKASTMSFDESTSRGRDLVSISDTGTGQSTDNVHTDSYRSLQLYDGRKFGKLVKFEGMDDETGQALAFYEKRYSGNNFQEKELMLLKVPDILNLNRTNMTSSHSESSLDQISSSTSSKNVPDGIEPTLCSEV